MLDGWVETLSDQVGSCHAKLDGLTDVCKQQFDDLQTKADGLANTLASVSALLANASQRPATRTSGDPLVSAVIIQSPQARKPLDRMCVHA